jgi:hypothetical protein
MIYTGHRDQGGHDGMDSNLDNGYKKCIQNFDWATSKIEEMEGKLMRMI